MFKPLSQDIFEQWSRFLIDAELAHNYEGPYRLYTHQHLLVPKNPILERLLPSLLYLQLCVILDDALKLYIHTKKLKAPKRDSFEARITFLRKGNYLQDAEKLQAIRKRRNTVAHTIDASVNWEEFEVAKGRVEKELQHLGFVGRRPRFSVYGFSGGGSPLPPDAAVKRRSIYSWGLRIDGKKLPCFSWHIDTPQDIDPA